MSNISKLDFAALEISGNIYLRLTLDAQIHLTADNLGDSPQQKAKAMIFLRHHLHEDLKREYLTIKDPLELWTNLKKRFDHQKLVLLPRARYEWIHLRLQDFKTVSEYNSALFRISSNLKLCGDTITDDDMLEKTLSVFHASNMVLAQQYKERKFTKYSELISCLLVVEQNNKLLLQNHQARPVGASPFPEANVATNQSERGKGKRRGLNRGRGRGRNNTWKREYQNSKADSGETSRQHTRRPSKGKGNVELKNVCHRCGMSNHWSRTCRTPKHLVEAYLKMMKENEKQVETNLIEDASKFPPHSSLSQTHLEAIDFIENVRDV